MAEATVVINARQLLPVSTEPEAPNILPLAILPTEEDMD